jgi:hypothetical protein
MRRALNSAADASVLSMAGLATALGFWPAYMSPVLPLAMNK